jgi:hypothetical protein
MEYQDYVEQLARTDPELAGNIAGFHTLERVMEWMRKHDLPLGSIDLVTQDEFTHDFLVPLAQENRYLVFGIT